ncbi:MAG TPA: hypothetical protein VG742_18285 [Dongiaceae bacterium]|nr:hypothetical protein [Dongiaceae bacterium]
MKWRPAHAGIAPPPPKLGPAVWLWPVAAGVLAAWPVWRSLFPEVPDIDEGGLRLQPLLGVGAALLYAGWAFKWRGRVRGSMSLNWVIAAATALLLIRRIKDGDTAGADLDALVIGWTTLSAIFATLVLHHVQRAGVEAGCKSPPHLELLPPLPRLDVLVLAALGALLVAMAVIGVPQSSALLMGVVSPGLILAWASLSDTARSILARRQVHFADAGQLMWLARRRRWHLRAPTVLLNDRVKLVSLYPAMEIKPGELVGLAAATTMEEETDIGRAIQEFGVSHRIRLPALRQARDGQSLASRQALLASGVIVELCTADDSLDLSTHAEAIELAQAQHRIVMAVVERAPDPRLLGILVFAIGARAGATEALRVLRDRRVEVALSAPPRDAADEIALRSLRVENAPFDPSRHRDVTSIWRGATAPADGGDGLSVAFGGVRPKAAESRMHLIVGREDARSLIDLARFADDFRARTKIVTLFASVPGWVLIAAAFGYAPVTPFLVTGVAVLGIIIATVTPQVLRLSPALDNEGTEE